MSLSENKEYYNDLINSRQQYDCWDLSKTVPKEDIEYILEQFHRRAAVKQNQVKYKINVLDWSNPKLRNDIFNYTLCEEDIGDVQLTPNAQSLANWILVFDVDGRGPRKINSRELREDALVEVGIAADFISHAATAIGLQTGFCRCIGHEEDFYNPILEKELNILNPKKNIALILGIGHGLANKSMINPYTGENVRTWSRVFPETRKISMDRYLKFHTN